MRRYELTAGSSSKFWEAELEGDVLTVRFGRSGTSGQRKDKRFASPEAARQERDRLVREKTGKGYRPVEDEGEPSARDSAADARAETTGTETATGSGGEAPETASIFTGTPLPTRTRPGKPLDPAADWAAFVRLVRSQLAEAPPGAQTEALAARLDGEPPAPDAARARGFLDDLRAALPGTDQRGWGEKPGPGGAAARAAFAHFARWLVARSGADVLVALFDNLRPRPVSAYGTLPASLWDIPTVPGTRAALVATSDAEYEAALAACLRLYAAEPELGLFLSYVLADDRLGAGHDLLTATMLERHGDQGRNYGTSPAMVPHIADLPPAQAAPWQVKSYHRANLSTCDVGAAEAAATVIAVARAAGAPTTASLVWLLRDAVGADRTTIARALLDTRTEDALAALLPFTGAKLVRDALDAGEAAFPDWMLRAYLATMDGKGEAAYGPRALALAARHGDETARAWAASGGTKLAGRLDRMLGAQAGPAAAITAWPPVLRDPPWRRKTKAAERIEIALTPIPTPLAHAFDAEKALGSDSYARRAGHIVDDMSRLAAWIREAESKAKYDIPIPSPAEPVPAADVAPDIALAWLDRRLDLTREGFTGFFYFNYGSWFHGTSQQPEPLALLLWEKTGPLTANYLVWRETIAAMVVRFGERAVPGLAAILAADPAEMLPYVADLDAAGIAPPAARAFLKTKRARGAAADWLRRHPRTAAMRLLPDALGAPGPERDAADAALRFLVGEPEGRAAFDAALAAYAAIDPGVHAAAASGVDSDPLAQVPGKIARLPTWIVPSALPRPVLAEGGALPDEAVTALCEMLAFSPPLTPYAGIAQVRAACTAESLDAFALGLFQAWLAAGANAAGEWAMRACALIGGDACARDLTRQIRVWGQAGLKARGKAGIAVLAEIGTDVALMNLSALAEKNPLLQLREAARAAIAEAAEARGLGEVELADRLSPDLGLDARGALDLSFGPRSFRVGFDETLKPWLRDAEGRRLTALPRAAKTDDAERAKAAGRLWAGLRKDAEAAARLQITRLETMLATGRRVAPDVFWPFFAAHPLIRHLAGRLVWGLYADGLPTTRPQHAFRLAEDLSATDAADEGLDLDIPAAAGLFGLVHPLHLEPEALAAWTGLFGDYEIAQPFPQLGRETYAFSETEKDSARTERFSGVKVAGRRLRGLRAQGWSTDTGGEHISSVQRSVALPGGASLSAMLGFADGFWHRAGPEGDGIQTLRALILSDGRWGASTTHRFGDLDPVTASELLRTPSLLAATGGE